VQPALNLVALKAMPVIVLGGLTSIPGAIVGGLIIGASEKLFEVYFGSIIGGATESWVPYVVAIAFLLVRPAGLFGTQELRRI
jgi:branched-chain amino acid transport system permease protein